MIRPRILLYTEAFLSPSMTFIARQITALQTRFEISVLARTRLNEPLFPFDPVEVVPITTAERIRRCVRRQFHGREWGPVGPARQALAHAITRQKPALVHAHFGPHGLTMLPYARKLGIPLLTTFHGFDASSYLERRTYRRDLRDLFSYSEVITVSQEMRCHLVACGADPARTHCHYIGVPLSLFSAPDRTSIAERRARHQTLRFLQVSNFVEKKGHEYTVRAFAQLLCTYPHCELVLTGSGPLVDRIQQLVGELGIAKQVQFLGHQNSTAVAALMREADCFLHHSVTAADGDKEGIPTVLMEAMATGLPVISTRHSGIPELIEHGVEGLLVGERDVADYVQCLSGVLNDDGRLGARARIKVARSFDLEKCTNSLGARYDQMLGAPPPGAPNPGGPDRI